jgi:Predicted xylanase/chitin deacetylase
MKNKLLFIVLLCSIKQQFSYGQKNIETDILEIADFYNFKSTAVTFTFDDGWKEQFIYGVPILDKYNFKGTFFINPGNTHEKDFALMQKAFAEGHEIGSHSTHHPDLRAISIDSAEAEIKGSQILINNRFGNNTCQTFCYPFGSRNDLIKKLVAKYYIASRSLLPTFHFDQIKDYYDIPSSLFVPGQTLTQLNNLVDKVISNRRWLVEVYHGFEGKGYNPVPAQLFDDHLNYISSKDSLLWIGRFVDVIKYLREKEEAKVDFSLINDSTFTLNLTDDLPDSIYNFPLSFRIFIPMGWDKVKVLQNDTIINSYTKIINSKNFLYFNTIPNKGLIKIVGQVSLDFSDNEVFGQIYPNPFNDNINVYFEVLNHPEPITCNLTIVEVGNGRLVYRGKIFDSQISIDTNSWPKGLYAAIFSYTLNNEVKSFKKLILK